MAAELMAEEMTLRDLRKARALTQGRLTVSFDDIRALALPVMRHRILTNFHAESEGRTTEELVAMLLDAVPRPQSGM